jgi:hypothetical protein
LHIGLYRQPESPAYILFVGLRSATSRAFFDDQLGELFCVIQTQPFTAAVRTGLSYEFFDSWVHPRLMVEISLAS